MRKRRRRMRIVDSRAAFASKEMGEMCSRQYLGLTLRAGDLKIWKDDLLKRGRYVLCLYYTD